jgi:hypothetical protein
LANTHSKAKELLIECEAAIKTANDNRGKVVATRRRSKGGTEREDDLVGVAHSWLLGTGS